MGARASRPLPFVLSQIRCGGSLSKGSCPLSRLPIWDNLPQSCPSHNHTNHSSDNPLRAPSCPSWTIPVIPTAHPSFRRRPESRGARRRDIPLITIITKITVQTTPFAPLSVLRGQSPSFQPPTRHSNRPPVIPAAAGIQRGEAAGHPTNHKNHTNHSSDKITP